MTGQRVVVLGATLAGGNAARGLRDRGFDGDVVLVGAEDEAPYERPPLSKQLMQGDRDEPDWVLERSPSAWADRDIELRTGTRARAIDASARSVVLADGDRVPYDSLVLATGAQPVVPDLPGTDLEGVHLLRTWSDGLALREAARSAGRLVVLGGSWIGCEVAASLRQQGCDVEVIEAADSLLPKLSSRAVSDRIEQLHQDHGVRVRLGASATALVGSGRVEAVELAAGRIETPLVLVAVGVRPDLALTRSAGLAEASGGVAVDALFRTSDPAISAVGDLAAIEHPLYGRHIRVEHWDVAQQHGGHVAQVLAGETVPYARPPMFFSDQYDLGFEYRGWLAPEADAQVVVRGSDPAGAWYVFWLVGGRVQAVLNANAWDDGDALWLLAARRPALDPDDLADPAVPIADLVS